MENNFSSQTIALAAWSLRTVFLWCAISALRGKFCLKQPLVTDPHHDYSYNKQMSSTADFMSFRKPRRPVIRPNVQVMPKAN